MFFFGAQVKAKLREFLHVDDLANAVVFALENVLPDYLYNVGY